MNTLKKIRVEVAAAVSLGVLALGSAAAPAHAGSPFALVMPEVSAMTAQVTNEIGQQIATELKATLAQVASAPRPARSPRAASVFITESNAVVVEATRLPRLDMVADAHAAKPTTRSAL